MPVDAGLCERPECLVRENVERMIENSQRLAQLTAQVTQEATRTITAPAERDQRALKALPSRPCSRLTSREPHIGIGRHHGLIRRQPMLA